MPPWKARLDALRLALKTIMAEAPQRHGLHVARAALEADDALALADTIQVDSDIRTVADKVLAEEAVEDHHLKEAQLHRMANAAGPLAHAVVILLDEREINAQALIEASERTARAYADNTAIISKIVDRITRRTSEKPPEGE